ncbi:MAG: exodeoxyribonuclease V subunit alpha [Betaproteobacteria bacterium]|nr:exodeoxyribonuclease V subunit alpha [Betaproteobacteria bacterium]
MTNTASPLAEGFAQHVARWAERAGCDAHGVELARAAAQLVSTETQAGHVCAHIDALPPPWQAMLPDALHTALLATGVVSDGADEPKPLVADGKGRLYLWRYFDYERRLAVALRSLARPRTITHAQRAELARQLDTLFPADKESKDLDRQKLAAALALYSGLCVISGGPGTGKTHTVVALLAALLTQEPTARVALAAPTGKAAARLMDTLRSRATDLPEALRERLPSEASTVHRLLGVTSEAGRFLHHRDNPLPLDTLIVDEASMLDLALATHLVEALPDGARLILLGDKDQLSAVEAGAVFAELATGQSFTPACASALAELLACAPEAVAAAGGAQSPLPDAVVWLTESRRFRADSGIGRLAADINAGRGEAALEWMQAQHDNAMHWIDDPQPAPNDTARGAMLHGYAAYFEALRNPQTSSDPAALMAAFGRYQILCAVQAGPRGVVALNDFIGQHVRRLTASVSANPWHHGRAVMILRNDYALRIFNGDIGICIPNAAGELVVAFPDAAAGWRLLTPSRLPEHSDAFAMTVHKSQGSEFERVHLVLPERPVAVLTRELVYTAITRATQAVEISGRADVFISACRNPTQRRSGLGSRLSK